MAYEYLQSYATESNFVFFLGGGGVKCAEVQPSVWLTDLCIKRFDFQWTYIENAAWSMKLIHMFEESEPRFPARSGLLSSGVLGKSNPVTACGNQRLQLCSAVEWTDALVPRSQFGTVHVSIAEPSQRGVPA